MKADNSLVVNAPPIVKIDNIATCYGYSISGSFDFSQIPIKHHQLFLVILLTKLGVNFEIYDRKEKGEIPQTFWEKIKNKFN